MGNFFLRMEDSGALALYRGTPSSTGVRDWVYTVTLSTPSQSVTFPNLTFSPRNQQDYNPCVPRNNMAGAELPVPFQIKPGEQLTISVAGNGGDIHKDFTGKVRLDLDGTTSCP